MSAKEFLAGAMRAITISRQYGGGGEIGARLAARLHWRPIDHELVAQVAQELGISERVVQKRDEYTEGFIARLLNRIPMYPLTTPSIDAARIETARLTPYQQTECRDPHREHLRRKGRNLC